MDTARLILEHPCEVCGEPPDEHDGPTTDGCQGSGGSRTVLDPTRLVELRRAVADWRESTGPTEELHRGTRLADLVDALLSEEEE